MNPVLLVSMHKLYRHHKYLYIISINTNQSILEKSLYYNQFKETHKQDIKIFYI